MAIGTYVLEDPLFNPDQDDEPLLIAHFPTGSRLERAISYMCQELNLDFYEIPTQPLKAPRKSKLKEE